MCIILTYEKLPKIMHRDLGLVHLDNKSPKISDAKVKEQIFVGSQEG